MEDPRNATRAHRLPQRPFLLQVSYRMYRGFAKGFAAFQADVLSVLFAMSSSARTVLSYAKFFLLQLRCAFLCRALLCQMFSSAVEK
jgi:hypothetical protein